MIKFITDKESRSNLSFANVKLNQFFVSDRYLCQKVCDDAYTQIADEDGVPYAGWVEECDEDFEVERIVENISKIEF